MLSERRAPLPQAAASSVVVSRPVPLVQVLRETAEVFTLVLGSGQSEPFPSFAPGQFNMVYVMGTGEVPVSISGDPAVSEQIQHTVRPLGHITRALQKLRPGDSVGLRGPYGHGWPLEEARGQDLVLIAGGIGLASLRPMIHYALDHRLEYGRVTLLYGARSAADLLYRKELEAWRGRLDVRMMVTVDLGGANWRGEVGPVTSLLPLVQFEPASTVAMVCGPEVLTRQALRELMKRGLPEQRIHVWLERNIKCGLGVCGHCQFGGSFACQDGPVYRLDRISSLFGIREI